MEVVGMNLLDFGSYLRGMRIRTRKTLRQFCIDGELDAVICSKIERGMMKYPDGAWLEKYAVALGLDRNSEAWSDLLAKANSIRGGAKKVSEKEICAKLPVLVSGGAKLNDKQKDNLIDLISKN
jgi:hypothetical protein